MNVLKFPNVQNNELTALIHNFIQDDSLSNFLIAYNFSIKHSIEFQLFRTLVGQKQLDKFLEKIASTQLKAYGDEYQDLLFSLRPYFNSDLELKVHSEKSNNVVELDSIQPSKSKDFARDLIEVAMADIQSTFEYFEKHINHRYGWFTPAWEVEKVLIHYFQEEDDPALVIHRYLEALFHSNSSELPIDQQYVLFSKQIAQELIKNNLLSDKSRQILLLSLPHTKLNEYEYTERLISSTGYEFKFLISYFVLNDIYISEPTKWLNNIFQSKIDDFVKHPTELYPLYVVLNEFASGNSLLDDEYNIPLDHTNIDKFLKKLRARRQKENCGASVISLQETYELKTVLLDSDYNHDPNDFLLEISSCRRDFCGGSISNFFNLYDPTDERKATIWNINGRMNAYLKYYYEIRDNEKLNALASAWFSFFIFSQAYATKGEIGDWMKIHPIILHELQNNNNHLIIALTYWMNISKANNKSLNYLRIQDIIPKNSKQPSHNFSIIDSYFTKSEVEMRIMNSYSENLIQKLSNKSYGFLLEGYHTYASMIHAIWKGENLEWGSKILPFYKMFESELSERLIEIYHSPEYRNFKDKRGEPHSKKPTLGNYLHLLSDAEKYLRNENIGIHEKITRKIRIDPDLFSDIRLSEKIFSPRNKAAHTESFKLNSYINELIKMTNQEDGLIKKFLLALN